MIPATARNQFESEEMNRAGLSIPAKNGKHGATKSPVPANFKTSSKSPSSQIGAPR